MKQIDERQKLIEKKIQDLISLTESPNYDILKTMLEEMRSSTFKSLMRVRKDCKPTDTMEYEIHLTAEINVYTRIIEVFKTT